MSGLHVQRPFKSKSIPQKHDCVAYLFLVPVTYPLPRTTLRQRLYSIRRALGLDCKKMGRLYGMNQKTWWWETGKHSPLSTRIQHLKRFLEVSYTEAMKIWPGSPPEDSRAVPATFRFKQGKPVEVKWSGPSTNPGGSSQGYIQCSALDMTTILGFERDPFCRKHHGIVVINQNTLPALLFGKAS